jgi:flavorubredoxin
MRPAQREKEANMQARTIKENIRWMGAVDWDRRLFDSLIPLPDGTSYNSYLITGSEKTALLDTVDPSMKESLFEQLQAVPRLDYLICHHAEQDHSGSIPFVLEKYKEAKVVTNEKCKAMLIDHLHISPERITTISDGDTLPLGNKTVKFIFTPWVHWPETMCSYLVEDRILFSCDFFGSHLAASDLYVKNEALVIESAKRYYAEIMMPFRLPIQGNLQKVKALQIDMIAPSHGPIYNRPALIIDAYTEWVLGKPKNEAVIAYVTMHDSTRRMVRHLLGRLAARGITVHQFDLPVTDIGKLAMSLVDAATVIIGAPTVHGGPHPAAMYAAYLANALRPKLKFASVVGSYGWGGKMAEHIAGMLSTVKPEIISPVIVKGLPREADYTALDALAETILQKHKESGIC